MRGASGRLRRAGHLPQSACLIVAQNVHLVVTEPPSDVHAVIWDALSRVLDPQDMPFGVWVDVHGLV